MNKVKHYDDKYDFAPGAENFPPMVILAYTYVCNSRCPYCPYTADPTARKKHADARYMSDETFIKIADEAGKHGALLRITGGGEPFLHKNIVKHMRYAVKVGCKVSIITNGSKDVSELIDVVDMIEFSVDAGKEEDYLIARPGLDWSTLNKNVNEAIKKRKKTRIIASIIKQKGIDVDLAQKHWSFVDAVQIRKFLSFNTRQDNSADKSAYLPPEKSIPCPWLWDRILINTKGEFTVCNIDVAFEHKFSSLDKESIAQAWRGPVLEDMRKKHLDGKINEIPICSGCKDLKYRSWKYSYFKLREYANSNHTT